MKHILAFVLTLCSLQVNAEEPPRASAAKLDPWWVVTELPRSGLDTLKFSFQRDSVPVWWGVIVSSALLYSFDDPLYEDAMRLGRRWGLGNEDKTKTVLAAGPYPIFRAPTDTGSALYFLGDGWTHFGAVVGFSLYGHVKGETRAWNTGLEIMHGMIVSTIFNQAIKRSTGRESPNQRTEERGAWRPFPSINAYNSHTSKFDAVPSGHVMTATLTFTTIRLNYPEYDHILLPLQVVWSSALMFQMMNNGVHWASDYPLGIAMGWAVAKVVVRNAKQKTGEAAATDVRKWYDGWAFTPTANSFGDTMMGVVKTF